LQNQICNPDLIACTLIVGLALCRSRGHVYNIPVAIR
jgi:hypothetical protein